MIFWAFVSPVTAVKRTVSAIRYAVSHPRETYNKAKKAVLSAAQLAAQKAAQAKAAAAQRLAEEERKAEEKRKQMMAAGKAGFEKIFDDTQEVLSTQLANLSEGLESLAAHPGQTAMAGLRVAGGARVPCQLAVEVDGKRIWEQKTSAAADNPWKDWEVDLSAYKGQRVWVVVRHLPVGDRNVHCYWGKVALAE